MNGDKKKRGTQDHEKEKSRNTETDREGMSAKEKKMQGWSFDRQQNRKGMFDTGNGRSKKSRKEEKPNNSALENN